MPSHVLSPNQVNTIYQKFKIIITIRYVFLAAFLKFWLLLICWKKIRHFIIGPPHVYLWSWSNFKTLSFTSLFLFLFLFLFLCRIESFWSFGSRRWGGIWGCFHLVFLYWLWGLVAEWSMAQDFLMEWWKRLR